VQLHHRSFAIDLAWSIRRRLRWQAWPRHARRRPGPPIGRGDGLRVMLRSRLGNNHSDRA